jgi:hypothetical protein
MAMPDTDVSVILATARAQVFRVLTAYKDELAVNKNKAAIAQLTATIEALTQLVTDLSNAVVLSLGCSVVPPAPTKVVK